MQPSVDPAVPDEPSAQAVTRTGRVAGCVPIGSLVSRCIDGGVEISEVPQSRRL